jgi:hypothetical protein
VLRIYRVEYKERQVIDTKEKEKVKENGEVKAEAYLGNIRLNLKARHANSPQRHLLL